MASKPGGRGGKKKFTSKGGNRHFSDFEELKKQTEEIKREKALQRARQDESGSESDDAPKATEKVKVVNFDKLTKTKQPSTKKRGDDSGSASDSESGGGQSSSEDADDEEDGKAKGVQHLIDIENPNRQQQKMKKIKDLNFDDSGPSIDAVGAESDEKQPLSRKEREALEAERKRQEYQRLHAMGKTDQARADLARLAIIRKQREEAAKKREDEKKAKEQADLDQAKQKLAGKN